MRSLIPFLFLGVFIGLIVLANIYLTNRFTTYFTNISKLALGITFTASIIFSVVGLIFATNSTSLPGNWVYNISSVLMGFLLFLILSALTLHLTSVFIQIKPQLTGLITLGLAVLVSVLGILNSFNTQTIKKDVTIDGLNKSIKAMHLTDIHLGHMRGKKWMNKMVKLTNDQNPDVVFITGDLFDGKIRLNEEYVAPLKEIKVPIYFVEGNHDDSSDEHEVKNMLKKIGVRVMENEVVTFNDLQIVGLDHLVADHKTFDVHGDASGPTIQTVLEKLPIDRNKPSILLHHSPNGIKYADKAGIDLFLCGHTHAGQIFPANLIAKLMFPYNKGMHIYNNTKLYVSHGAGTFGPPMRIGTRSEVTLFNLSPK